MNNLSNEKILKTFIILLALVLVVGVYFFSGSLKKPKKSHTAAQEQLLKKTKKPKIKEEKNMPISNKIQASSRDLLLKQAAASAGRGDPFAYSQRMMASASGQGSLEKSILPAPPVFNDGSSPFGLPSVPTEGFSIKGFMGNKVIISIDNMEEALRINETFRGVKVIDINTNNLSATFIKDGIRVEKTLNSLVNFKDSKNVIKYVK